MQAQEFLGARRIVVDVVERAREQGVPERTRAGPAHDMRVQRGGTEDDEFGHGEARVREPERG